MTYFKIKLKITGHSLFDRPDQTIGLTHSQTLDPYHLKVDVVIHTDKTNGVKLKSKKSFYRHFFPVMQVFDKKFMRFFVHPPTY